MVSQDKELREALEIIAKWLGEVSKTNDENIKATDSLNVVLVNLQLEDTNIPQNTGIVPIAAQIARVMQRIHDNTDHLRKDGRQELHKAFAFVSAYLLQHLDEEREK